MDMKKILAAFDNASSKPAAGASDMKKFVSIVKENSVKQEAVITSFEEDSIGGNANAFLIAADNINDMVMKEVEKVKINADPELLKDMMNKFNQFMTAYHSVGKEILQPDMFNDDIQVEGTAEELADIEKHPAADDPRIQKAIADKKKETEPKEASVLEDDSLERKIANSGMPLKYIEQQFQESGLEPDIRRFLRWAIDNGSAYVEDAIELGEKGASKNPEIVFGLHRLKKLVGQQTTPMSGQVEGIHNGLAFKDYFALEEAKSNIARQGISENSPFPQIPDYATFVSTKPILYVHKSTGSEEFTDPDPKLVGKVVGTSDHNGFHLDYDMEKYLKQVSGWTNQDIAPFIHKFSVAKNIEKGLWKVQQGVAEAKGKIKGVDGKACWPGHRYAGKEKKADGSYKDKCVPVKKSK